MEKPKINVELTKDGFVVQVVAPVWREKIRRDILAIPMLLECSLEELMCVMGSEILEKGTWQRIRDIPLSAAQRAGWFLTDALNYDPESAICTPDDLLASWQRPPSDIVISPEEWRQLITPAVEAALRENWDEAKRLALEVENRAWPG